ncbi:hypothetical protein MRX96_041118 [Rhipicephalus microplus]
MPAKTPFSEDEKDVVQDLMLKYKAVIENKRGSGRKRSKSVTSSLQEAAPPPPPMDERLAKIEGIVPHLTYAGAKSF